MYVANYVAQRTRSKRKKYEYVVEDRGRNKKKDEDFDIKFLSDSEDSGEGKAFGRNVARKFSKHRGETSKNRAGNMDRYSISFEEEDDFGGKNPRDAESVASFAVPSAKRDVKEAKICFLDEVKDMAKGKDKLQRDVKRTGGNICRTGKKVRNKVDKSCHEDVRTSKQPNCSFTDPYVISSDDDDGDSIPNSSEHEVSIPINTDTGSEEQSDTTDESSSSSSSSYGDVGDKDYDISDHKSSQNSESDASSKAEEEESLLKSSKLNFRSPTIGETERKSREMQQSPISFTLMGSGSSSASYEDYLSEEEENWETIQLPKASTKGRKTLERQRPSILLENDSSTSYHEDNNLTENGETNQLPKACSKGRKSPERKQPSILMESNPSTSNHDDNSPEKEKNEDNVEKENDMFEKMASEQGVKKSLPSVSRLPLKFSFEEEIPKPQEKSDFDKEVDRVYEDSVEKENEETNQLPEASWRRLETGDDAFNILANSILHQDDMLQKMASEQAVEKSLPTRLPLKFSFEEEIPEPPEKSDFDKEVDEVFGEMFFAIECGNMDYNSQAKVDEDYAESSETSEKQCAHVYILNEEIGLICRLCSHVQTEIRDILPSFATLGRRSTREWSSRKEKGIMSDAFGFEASSGCKGNSSFEINGTVWDSLEGIGHTLYEHQREGFEFLWRNIGGSIHLSQLSADPSEVGGCIISHAPGTGKTRLAIMFIQSYLKLFPQSRPIIIAPVNMLNTWEEEFEKWNVRFPFHNLNRDEHSGKEDKTALELISKSNEHKSDLVRMSKLYSWDRGSSILGISYSLYVKLAGNKTQNRSKKQQRMPANEELKEENNPWRNILLEKPGLVILDEGHTPRNDRSNIWNTLVGIRTRKIIILSGTPFQNNFTELLNSVRLIRPEVEEGFRNERTFLELIQNLKYSRRQADPSKDEAQGKAINKFKAAIEPFVHVHKGSILQQTLPGLRDSVIILNPHELQKTLLEEMEISPNTFEFEHKVALVSVHPQLFKLYSLRKDKQQGTCQDKLEFSTLLPDEGVKTRFVLELVHLSLCLDEKVLIFSQYKEPLHLIRDQLKTKFSWQEGNQILLLEGGTLKSKRQNIIHLFNDPNSEVKVLLASTKCCSEGISLVGASRVVLLDVVWNPSVAMQAISRAYRIGQKKLVYAYHLMISGTMEADKYRRQAEKERLSELVFTSTNKEVDEQQRMPKIAASDDKILAEMLTHHSMKDIFDRVIDQPKDSSFFKGFI